MDTTLYTNYHKNLYHCDIRNYNVSHPIRNIIFDNIENIRKYEENNKLRPHVLENIEKMLLCRTFYLGYDLFECPHCGNESISPRCCHSRFCNSCGVKYAKMLASKAKSFCLDVPHRHIVFTIPECLRNLFRKYRTLLNLLFIASRNTISAIVNNNIYKRLKRKYNNNIPRTKYLYKNFHDANNFGMISTLHTFGRDLKWNPHIHALVPELIYNQKNNSCKTYNYFNYTKLRDTFMYELLRLLEEKIGPIFRFTKRILYDKYKNGFYIYARRMNSDKEYAQQNNTENVNAVVTYTMRYTGRPAMAESRIIKYSKEDNTVQWFYHDHADNKKYIVNDPAMKFIEKLMIHIPDKHFRTVRYYGFYSNKSQNELDSIHDILSKERNIDYSKKKRQSRKKHFLNKLKYRTHLVDTFNRDPLKCKCGHYLVYIDSYDPLKGIKDVRLYRKNSINEMQKLRIRRASPSMGT